MQVELTTDGDGVSILKINDSQKFNTLSDNLMNDIYEKLAYIEQKSNVLILTGTEKSFAVGVNISEIAAHSFESAYLKDFINYKWERISNIKIPVIAAVSGYALGGGFELALMCDMIVASEKAVFGFPEVNLGIMPGMGGTQMLTRIVGVKTATEIIMTGRYISAEEARKMHIVSYVTKQNDVLSKSMEIAKNIAGKPSASIRAIKDAIRMSQEVGLHQGITSERMMFKSLFATEDKVRHVQEFLNRKK